MRSYAPNLAPMDASAARSANGCNVRQTRRSRRRIRETGVDPDETLALPKGVEHRSLTALRETLVKIGAKVISHGRYVTLQLAEVAVPREPFRQILCLIDDLRPRPIPT